MDRVRPAPLLGRAVEIEALVGALHRVRDRGEPQVVLVVGAPGFGKTRLLDEFVSRSKTGVGRIVRAGCVAATGDAVPLLPGLLRSRFGLSPSANPEAQKTQVRTQFAAAFGDREVGDLLYFVAPLLGLEVRDSPLAATLAADHDLVRRVRRMILRRLFEHDSGLTPPAPTASAGGGLGTEKGRLSRAVPPQTPSPGARPNDSIASGGPSGIPRPLLASRPMLPTRPPSPSRPPLPSSPPSSSAFRERKPLVVLVDDLHAAEDEGLEAFFEVAGQIQAPILFVATLRPELAGRCGELSSMPPSRAIRIDLEPLHEAAAQALADTFLGALGDAPHAQILVDAAAARGGGSPGRIEAIARSFFELGVVEENSSAVPPEPALVIHPYLLPAEAERGAEHAALRVASLEAPERRLLEAAAVMGDVFWVGGLVAARRRREPQIPPSWSGGEEEQTAILGMLSSLADREFVLSLGEGTFEGEAEFVFKQAGFREAILEATSPKTKTSLHAAIADWIAFKPTAKTHEEHAAMLAEHREAAGAFGLAAAALLAAGEAARKVYAHVRAEEHYAKALALFHRSPSIVDPDDELSALHHHGDALQSLGRIEHAAAAFRSMLARAYQLDRREKAGAAHGRLGRLYRELGRFEEASTHLTAARSFFEAAQDPRGIAGAIDDLAKLDWLKGEYETAREGIEKALAMRRKIGDRRSIALSLNNLGLVLQETGSTSEARAAFEQALQIRREIGDLVGVATTLSNLGTTLQDERDDARALPLFEEALRIAQETGDRPRIGLVATNLGESLTKLGRVDDALRVLKSAADAADELGDKVGFGDALRALAKAHLAKGDYTKARELAARAVTIFEEMKSDVHQGVALRTLGEVTAAGAAGAVELGKAREHLRTSITIFERLGNEVELARSCRAYADMAERADKSELSERIREEAIAYGLRAESLLARIQAGGDEGDRRASRPR